MCIRDRFSYIGGFAGEYTGTLSGLEKDIQLSGCYGNCLDGAGKTLPAIGNKTSSTVEAEKEVLKKMSLTERDDVADKLFELFHVTLYGFTEQQLQSIVKAIYETLSKEAVNNDQGSWVTADMTAFEDAYNTERSLTDEEIQNYINYVAERCV